MKILCNFWVLWIYEWEIAMKQLFASIFLGSILLLAGCGEAPAPQAGAETPVRPVRYIVV